MKLTDEQRELIALIPKAIRKSKEYTDATKLVLGQIDFMHGTDFAEVNGYVFSSDEKMSEETGVSERQVRRVVKILVNEGLITTIRGNRTKEGKIASKYWLTDLYYELANRPKPKNVHLIGGQNEIEEKNVHLDIELEPETDIKNMMEYTCTGENNAKNQHNMKIDERLITENEKDAWDVLSVDDNFDYTQYEDVSRMVQSDAGNIGMMENPTYFEKKKNNEYVSKVFKKLKYYISEYKKSTSVEMANDWGIKVNNVYDSLDRSKFTESQWVTISNMIDEFDTLYEHKEKFLSKKYHKHTGSNVTKKTVSSENSIISDGLSESEHCPSPAPSIEYEDNMMIMRATMSEDEIAQLSKKSTKQEEKKYGEYDSVDEWLKAFDEKWGLTTQEPMVSYNTNINAMNYGQC